VPPPEAVIERADALRSQANAGVVTGRRQ
jgi:hypothetical protein